MTYVVKYTVKYVVNLCRDTPRPHGPTAALLSAGPPWLKAPLTAQLSSRS
ncbi:hypothetical protein SSCG_00684 [Streptomyces clavuligerus]|nr:hypothetical protein SSCG_00684 [Streptomyces clavuligerus]